MKDEDSSLLQEPTLVRERRVEWFCALLNIKLLTLRPGVIDLVKKCLACIPLGDVPSILQVEQEIRGMAKRKAVDPKELPSEHIKLFLDGDRGLFSPVPRFHSEYVTAGTGATTLGERTDHGVAQNEGPGGVRQLPRHLPCGELR